MAWTDSSRTTLIEEIKTRAVLWDRSAQMDPNARVLKHEAMNQVVEMLNESFYPHDSKQQYTADEVRSQWKNLKDTYKRKQRWLTEGKYSRDPAEEPTWKFFRLLKFLDKNEDGNGNGLREDGNTNSNDATEVAKGGAQTNGQSHFGENCNGSAEEHALSFLFKSEPDMQTVTETILARAGGSPQGRSPSPPPLEPPRKRGRPPSAGPPPNTVHSPPVSAFHHSSAFGIQREAVQDEFHHFGFLVGATLRRIGAEGHRIVALRLQKKISDMLFESQLGILQKE